MQEVSCFLNSRTSQERVWPENDLLSLAIGLLFIYQHHAGADLEHADGVPRLEKKLHPIDGVAHQPGSSTSLIGRFQEASDWPSQQKGRFHEAALLVINRSNREVVEESSCQSPSLRVP
jgi:hypothetical protein